MNGKETGVPFTKENQPSPEAKSMGWLKKNKGPELVKAIFDLAFQGNKRNRLKKAAAQYYGLDEKEVAVEMMLVFRQIEKAIQKSNTQAFTAVMDRAYGKPKEKIDHTTGGKPISTPVDLSKVPLKTLLELASHIDDTENKE